MTRSLRRFIVLAIAGAAAASPALADGTRALANSREGRPVEVVTLAGPGDADARPAIAVIAGLDGRHTVGTDVARAVARKFRAEHADLLETYTVYIIAAANPDAANRFRTSGRAALDFGGSLVPVDDDHDRRIDEDGPRDINGDGVITMMRIENPAPGLGLRPTMVIDKDDPRLMRAAAADKGEVATHAVLVEGLDADGDGSIAEDGPGGVDFNRNFPYLWPETRTDSGPYPLSEPETRAIAEFLVARTNIMMVIVYGPGDSIVKLPEAGRMDYTGRVPTGIENDDKAAFDKLNTLFKDVTRINAAPAAELPGSLPGWAYAHLGIMSFSTPVWVRPDQLRKENTPEAGEAEREAPAADPDADRRRERQALIDQGVPERLAEFLASSRERRLELFRESMSMGEAERAQMMAQVQALSPDIRARLMAAVQEIQADLPAQGSPPPVPRAPDQPASETPAQPAGQPAAQPGGPRGPGAGGGRRGNRPGGQPGGPPGGGGGAPAPANLSDEAAWLKYASERNAGFVDWKPFDHPTLGKVEIGGFEPGFKFNPPESEIDRLADEQTRVLAGVLEKMPRVEFDALRVEDLGGGLWRISARIINKGELPSRAAIGVKARRRTPMRLAINLPEERVVSGTRLHRINRIEPSATTESQWIVRGAAGSTVELTLTSLEFGAQSRSVTLQAARPQGGSQ